MTYSVRGTTVVDVNRNVTVASANVTGNISFTDISIQGTVSGYTSAGGTPGLPTSYTNVIDKFPFATDGNATDVGDLTVARVAATGQSSKVSGYTSGGFSPPSSNVIDKFPFSTNTNATDVGDLTAARFNTAGQSSTIAGYITGGTPTTNTIEKFPFSIDSNSSDVGDLTISRSYAAGQSSSVSGYSSGGQTGLIQNVIDKFPFSTDSNATDVGDLTQTRTYVAGQSSTVSGYTSGGYYSSVQLFNTIDKFPFVTDSNATDVGDLTVTRSSGPSTGQSSTVSGYTSGGATPPALARSNIIDKFPFASNANATDVGDLTIGRYHPAGQQV